MGSFAASSVLALRVGVRNIELGRPVDLLVARLEWRVLGFDVLCGDGAHRFLAWAAAAVGEDEIAVDSALALMDDLDHYRGRARSFRALLGAPVGVEGRLRDLLIARDGLVTDLVVDHDGRESRRPPDGLAPAALPG